MKAKGASWDEHSGTKCSTYGAGCYGAGDGGLIEARLVTVKPDGTPDLANVLARETVDPGKRYFETTSAYGISTISLFWYFNMGGVAIKANTPYAMVYRNLHGDPAHNFSSANSPVVKASEAGPNGPNNLDPNAPGAIAGLDPREAVAWSTNGGTSWSWGREVGPYYGSTTSDEGVRLPHYAWQASPSSKPESNQPYSAYWGTCTPCTLTARSVPRATTLTEAGGYAPIGKSVGVVTVRNLRTGKTGRTAALGSGIARGRLGNPVDLAVGDSYEITHTGTVYRAEADNYVVQTLSVGSGAFPFTTTGYGDDRAELFALRHPFHAAAGTTSPPPPPPAEPTPTPTEPAPGNKAAGRPTSASSSESGSLTPANAVDGSATTRWSSGFSDNQWWQVDLGASLQVDRVEIDWERAYASRYKILTSVDGVSFSEAADVSISAQGLRSTTFAARAARYVRIQGVTRGDRLRHLLLGGARVRAGRRGADPDARADARAQAGQEGASHRHRVRHKRDAWCHAPRTGRQAAWPRAGRFASQGPEGPPSRSRLRALADGGLRTCRGEPALRAPLEGRAPVAEDPRPYGAAGRDAIAIRAGAAALRHANDY